MKNSVKRFIALLTTATMLATTCTVFAAPEGSVSNQQTIGGLEFDNSQEPAVGSVILPTINSGTFKFMIDPEDQLHEYRPDTFIRTGDGLYFESVATRGGIVSKIDSSASIQISKKASGATIASVGAAFTLSGGSITPVSPAATYYVWVPAEVATGGAGKYDAITSVNVGQYFVYDETQSGGALSISGFKKRIEDATTDGNVYKDETVDSTPGNYDPADYVTIDPATGNITEVAAGVTLTAVSSGTSIDMTASPSALKIEDATTAWTPKSSTLRIVNKSSKKYTITADVTVNLQSGSGLVYVESQGPIGATSDAAIHFDIESKVKGATGTAIEAVTTSSGTIKTGKATVDLNAASGSAIHYISQAYDNPAHTTPTGGDVFKQYLPADLDPEYVEFQIAGYVSTGATTHNAWKAYADKLADGTTTRPTLTVVYSFEPTPDTPAVPPSVNMGMIPQSVASDGQRWQGSGMNKSLEFVAPSTVTPSDVITSMKYSFDNSTYTAFPSDGSKYGIYNDAAVGKDLIWVKPGTLGDGKAHFYLQFVVGPTTYTAQLW